MCEIIPDYIDKTFFLAFCNRPEYVQAGYFCIFKPQSIRMKTLLLLLALNYLPFPANAQNPDSLWVVTNYTKIERHIPMRDGVKLFTSIYIPKDISEKHPILMSRTPYSCYPYGENEFARFWNSYHMEYLREGYIMVMQDVRGKWMSEGEFMDVRPFNPSKKTNQDIDEASDAYDAIDWLIKNIPNNNGKVGVFGISYPGFYSAMAAASDHPALMAVSPQAPVTNWFIGDDFHHNGAFFLMDAFSFYSPFGGGFGLPRPMPTTVGPKRVALPIFDSYKYFLEMGPLSNFSALMGDSVAFWNDIYAHPDYDEWWQARDARNASGNLKPAMLWVGGLFDAEDNWGAWNSYKAAEKNNPGKAFNSLVMGPWYHNQWGNSDGTRLGNINFGSNTSKWYQQNIEIPFFNYYLKNKGNISQIKEATIFMSGSNEWKKYSEWPPTGKEDKALFFQENGMLNWNHPTSKKGFDEYVSDPSKPVPYTEDVHFNRTRTYMVDDQRFAGRRTDVLTFKTEILSEDVTLTGTVKANLFASISTTDADFVVKLIDVFPDSLSHNEVNIYSNTDQKGEYPMGGYEMLVHGEILRGRYRKSLETPEPFIPNKIEKVSFNIADVAHTFKKGHRIMVQVQSSWFPLVDRNPQKFVNIYEAGEADFQKAVVRIYHDSKNCSHIVLPVLQEKAPVVQVYISSAGGDRLTRKSDIQFVKNQELPIPEIVLNDKIKYQKIDGFGASFNEAGMICLNSLSPEKSDSVMKTLFDPIEGAGYTLMKSPIAACDFSSAGPWYSYNDTPGDTAMINFSIERDLGPNGLIPFIKKAQKFGGFEIQSPMDFAPDWMLYSLNKGEKHVKPEYYAALAKYYAMFISAYKAQGISIDYMAPFNEPENVWYSNETYRVIGKMIQKYIVPEFKSQGITTKIQLCDAANRPEGLTKLPAALDDPNVRKHISTLTVHGYDWDKHSTTSFLHERYPEIPIWMTEVCYAIKSNIPPNGPVKMPVYEFSDGEFWGNMIMNDMKNQVSGWIYWNMILDENGGPWLISDEHGDPDNNNQQPVVIINRKTGEVSYTGLYYYLAHFSKFVKPGAYRIDSKGGMEQLNFAAFRNEDGSTALTVINNGEAVACKLRFEEWMLEITLEGHSISTFGW